MTIDDSVSQWIASLKSQDSEAAKKLWDRFSVQLVSLARRRLDSIPPGITDEEDIAQSVFASVWRGAIAGRLNDVMNRDSLWAVLIALTKRKVVDHIRRETAHKRGAGSVLSESSLASDIHNTFTLDWLIGELPTPDFMLALAEENNRLLAMLRDDRMRDIAMKRIEGYAVSEIADNLGISVRSVERKLQLIRTSWAKELFVET